jgi:hypothetical protein
MPAIKMPAIKAINRDTANETQDMAVLDQMENVSPVDHTPVRNTLWETLANCLFAAWAGM